MGLTVSKCYTKHIVEPRELRAKISLLEERIREITMEKQQNEQFFSLQRKRHRKEVAVLRRKVEEEEDTVRRLEAAAAAEKAAAPPLVPAPVRATFDGEWRPRMERDYMVELMREEQARKEAAMEKWKQLYLAIKAELDELILRTNEGGQFCWGFKQGAMVETLKSELKAKEEALQALRTKLVILEKEGEQKARELDIVRQSLRILSGTRRNRVKRNKKKFLHI